MSQLTDAQFLLMLKMAAGLGWLLLLTTAATLFISIRAGEKQDVAIKERDALIVERDRTIQLQGEEIYRLRMALGELDERRSAEPK